MINANDNQNKNVKELEGKNSITKWRSKVKIFDPK